MPHRTFYTYKAKAYADLFSCFALVHEFDANSEFYLINALFYSLDIFDQNDEENISDREKNKN